VDPQQDIQQLSEFEGRAPGSDAERRAATHLAERLEQMGRDSEVEPTSIWPRSGVTHTIHAVLAIVGSVVAVNKPFIGTLIVLVAVVSAFGDLTGAFFLIRRVTGTRASQNVVSSGDGEKPGVLYLVAHYDAGRGGIVFGKLWERRAAYSQRVRRPLGIYEPFFWALVVVLVCSVLRIVGFEGTVITVIQFLATVVLIVSVPLLIDSMLSNVSPGANDNASGVATVLRLAERYGGALEHLDVRVLFTGAQEAQMLGMRGFLKRHKGDLDAARTIFLNVDEVGNGTVRYISREGYVLTYPYHPALLELAGEIAEADEEEGRFKARALKSRGAGDAHAARSAGFPAISISCLNALDYAPNHHRASDTPEQIDPDALERAYGFCSELIELIDERIGPDLAQSGETTELSEAND
jgi:hypothetical protein